MRQSDEEYQIREAEKKGQISAAKQLKVRMEEVIRCADNLIKINETNDEEDRNKIIG